MIHVCDLMKIIWWSIYILTIVKSVQQLSMMERTVSMERGVKGFLANVKHYFCRENVCMHKRSKNKNKEQTWINVLRYVKLRYQLSCDTKTVEKHIEAETKWPPYHIRLYQMRFPKWKCMNFYKQNNQWSLFLRVQLTIFQHWFR